MTGKTTIEWTNQPGYVGAVWNPTTGCTRVSAGCDNCYAFALHDKRYVMNMKAAYAAVDAGPVRTAGSRIARARSAGFKLPWPLQYDLPFSRVQMLPERLDAPLRTRKPTCYFVDSMSDLFHEDVPDQFLTLTWATMTAATQHRFLILTKRPERMRAYLERRFHEIGNPPLPNIWLGTSVEDQASADERIPHLLATPAAVRFLSCEPLLGPVDLTNPLDKARRAWVDEAEPYCAKCKRVLETPTQRGAIECAVCHETAGVIFPNDRHSIDWVIVGGESGPRARPMDLAWARSLVAQCRAAGVRPFVKQLGSAPHDGLYDDGEHHTSVNYLKLHESHGRDMAEWPEDLRIREFAR